MGAARTEHRTENAAAMRKGVIEETKVRFSVGKPPVFEETVRSIADVGVRGYMRRPWLLREERS
jgi:hypothetical protein